MLMPSGVHEAMDVPFRLEPDQDWLPVTKFIDKPVNPEKLADEIEAIVGKPCRPRHSANAQLANFSKRLLGAPM